MATVKINTGPIGPDDLIRDVPRDRWDNLLAARRSRVHTRIPYDCRSLLRYVDEAEEYRMWEATGHADLDDYIRNGLQIDPEMVHWAQIGLATMTGEVEVPLAEAVEMGKRTAAQRMVDAPAEVGPGQGKRTDLDDELRSDTTKLGRGSGYLAARLKRDHPEIAARVEAGEFSSIYAAAIAAGIRRPTKNVPVDSPDAAIRALLRLFSVDDLAMALGRAAETIQRTEAV